MEPGSWTNLLNQTDIGNESLATSVVLTSNPLSPDMDPDAKREWKCAKITREILDTEKTYQHHLSLIARVGFPYRVREIHWTDMSSEIRKCPAKSHT